MKKKCFASLLCVFLFWFSVSFADLAAPQRVTFPPNQKFAVYSGPGTDFVRLAQGKAAVSTNEWIDVYGMDGEYLLIRYPLSESASRMGYISCSEAGYHDAPDLYLLWEWTYMRTTRDVSLTDDPLQSQREAAQLSKGTPVSLLTNFDSFAYVETAPNGGNAMRGFLPLDALENAPVPYENISAFSQAVDFFTKTGISFTVTGTHDNTLYLTLEGGGKVSYYYFAGKFNPYELGNWRFSDASNEDIARFLDASLALLSQVEAGLADEEHLKKDYHAAEGLGLRNIEATVGNGLMYLESLGKQGLDVLLHQLSLHDGNDALNSLRARLASRILGKLDLTPVEPEMGCAWYDALTLSNQDALPRVDASVYVQDPTLSQVTQLLIEYFDKEKASWGGWLDVDQSKTRNLVSLHVLQSEETQDRLILWANVNESQFALYDGHRAQALSGSWIPSRITLKKGADGLLEIEEFLQAQDGSLYAPSILEFCRGDQKLADRMMQDEVRDLWQCFEMYLQANGYGEITKIPY